MKSATLLRPTRDRRGNAWRSLRIQAQVVAAILVVGLFAAMAIQPTRQLLEQRERISTMTTDLRELQRSNLELEARIQRLKDPDFVEQRARDQIGLVRPGEIPFVVMPPSRTRKAERDARRRSEPVESPGQGFLEGFLDFVGL